MHLSQIGDILFRSSASLLIFCVFVSLITKKSVEVFNNCGFLFPFYNLEIFSLHFKALVLGVYTFRFVHFLLGELNFLSLSNISCS